MSYKNAFSLFLKSTNEKDVIFNFIRQHILLDKNVNFLDVGAGDGSLFGEISKHVGDSLAVEPNEDFIKILKSKGVNVVNAKWEDTILSGDYDFILVAYVITYFNPKERAGLVKKMYDLLSPGGKLLILSVDSQEGSWRGVHTYLYDLMGIEHKSSDLHLEKIRTKYNHEVHSFITTVSTVGIEAMMDVLAFDFSNYVNVLPKYRPELVRYLEHHQNADGRVILDIANNATIINKERDERKN